MCLGQGMSRTGSASCSSLVSAGPGPSPASASPPQSSQHQRGWSQPSSHSPRGWLLLPPFLPRPNQSPCWPPSKKRGCAGVSRATVMSQCHAHGWPWRGAGTSLAVPLTPLLSPGPVTPSPAPQLTWSGAEPVTQVGCRGHAGACRGGRALPSTRD